MVDARVGLPACERGLATHTLEPGVAGKIGQDGTISPELDSEQFGVSADAVFLQEISGPCEPLEGPFHLKFRCSTCKEVVFLVGRRSWHVDGYLAACNYPELMEDQQVKFNDLVEGLIYESTLTHGLTAFLDVMKSKGIEP